MVIVFNTERAQSCLIYFLSRRRARNGRLDEETQLLGEASVMTLLIHNKMIECYYKIVVEKPTFANIVENKTKNRATVFVIFSKEGNPTILD